MFCHQCGKEIEFDSRFCRYCGAAQSIEPPPAGLADESPVEAVEAAAEERDDKLGWIIGGGAGVFVLLVMAAVAMAPGKTDAVADAPGSNVVADTMVTNIDGGVAAYEAAADGIANVSDAGEKPTSPWSYTSSDDKVRGATTYYATTTSTNSIAQDSPYSATTTMDIIVRKSPAYGTDVLLTISSGQMMCPSYEGCSGTVRFDDGPPQRVRFNGPSDNSSETIFVEGAQAFIAKLKKAKRVVVEKTLYEAGNPQFEFNVAGLKWDH